MFRSTSLFKPRIPRSEITCVCFDGAGTSFDSFSISPVIALCSAFESIGIKLSLSQARGPMGIAKLKHIEQLLKEKDIAEQWRKIVVHDEPNIDVDVVYQRFLQEQRTILPRYTTPTPNMLDVACHLIKSNIQLAFNTAYSREEATICLEALKKSGLEFACTVTNSDVKYGRPAPDMLSLISKQLNVPASNMLSVGDTLHDAGAAKNFGCFFVGVTGTSSLLDINSLEEARNMHPDEFKKRCDKAADLFKAQGADAVITDMSELPAIISGLNAATGYEARSSGYTVKPGITP